MRFFTAIFCLTSLASFVAADIIIVKADLQYVIGNITKLKSDLDTFANPPPGTLKQAQVDLPLTYSIVFLKLISKSIISGCPCGRQ